MRVEPMRLLAGSAALVFLLLVAGFVAAGALNWRAAATAGLAVLIAALGLLYAWRLGAPGRRR